jgi:hypothetical protein
MKDLYVLQKVRKDLTSAQMAEDGSPKDPPKPNARGLA